ncbi:MAG TPA: extracellular solute-binding protein [Candidatus Faecivicinus avistercoris]|nr:extracellular solute-binding protein [Candidatus Faecivicinus avistercoris]
MKKTLSLLLALVVLLCMGGAFAEGEKITLQFWHSMSGSNADSIDYMVQKFNESQDEIEVVATFQGDYYTSIASAIMSVATGTGPDLIQTGSDQVRMLSDEEGVVANMLDFLSEEEGVWYEDFNPGFIDSYRMTLDDGTDYLAALPMGCSTPVLYCNKTLLDAAGCEVPTTWEEMEQVCATLVDGGYCDYGFAQPRDSWYFWMIIPNYSGQEVFSEDGLTLACREGGIEAFEFLQGLIEKNYFYPLPAADSSTIINQLMTSQECAFYINSIGGLAGMENNAAEGGFELLVSGIPGKAVNSVPSGGNSLVILESSAHKDACWEFVKWLYTSEDGIAYFDAQSGYLAVTDTIKNTAVLQEKIAANSNYANAYNFLENVNNNHRITGESDVATEVMTFMDAVFYDLEDVTEQWDILEEAVNEKLAEANEE